MPLLAYLPLGLTTLSLLSRDMMDDPRLGLSGPRLLGGLKGSSLLSLNGGSCMHVSSLAAQSCDVAHDHKIPGLLQSAASARAVEHLISSEELRFGWLLHRRHDADRTEC